MYDHERSEKIDKGIEQFQTLGLNKLFFTRQEAADLCQISLASLGRHIRAQIPPFTPNNITRLGRRVLISAPGLLDFAKGGSRHD